MKRFYQNATYRPDGTILLDEKPVNTPAKHRLQLPHKSLAKAVAAEWQAQQEIIDKTTMPLTGMACLAIDIALPRRNELIVELLEYGETDLIFYHALEEELAAEQRVKWQPWLNRAQVEFGTRYEITQNILPVAQAPENQAKHLASLDGLDQWQLATIATVTKPTNSLLLSWFFLQKALDAEKLYALSRLEETHNSNAWGEDEEAKAKADALKQEIHAAEQWRDLL